MANGKINNGQGRPISRIKLVSEWAVFYVPANTV